MKNIPKICHFCWTKDSPMSLLQVLSVYSFHKYNPDWKIIVHVIQQTTDELGENTFVPDYKGKDYFHMLTKTPYVKIDKIDLVEQGIGIDKHGILASDILRLKWLYEIGGVYSDFDMLWLQPMKNFKNITCMGDPMAFETTACFHKYYNGHHNNSNIISRPGGSYLKYLLEEQKEIKPPYSHQAFNSEMLNRLFPDSKTLLSRFPKVLPIAYETFYPYDIYHLEKLYLKTDLSPLTGGVIGVHWFNGHQLSRDYVDENHDDFKRECSMTEILRKEGW